MWEYRPGRPLVFNHIPKTAGTALRQALINSLGGQPVFEGMDRSTFSTFDEFDRIKPIARRSMVLEPADLPLDAVFVCGHLAPSTTRARYPGADQFTVLREPRVRLLSMWLFNRAHTDLMLRRWASYAVWFRLARGPMNGYLQDPFIAAHSDNGMIRFLLWEHPLIPADGFIDPKDDDAVLADALELLAGFGHVGLVEDPRFEARVTEWLGRELEVPRVNEVRRLPAAVRPDLAAELTDATRALIDERTRIDARLWDHFAATALPAGTDLAQVRDDTFARGVQRYAKTLEVAEEVSPVRQAAERIYGLKVRSARALGRRQ